METVKFVTMFANASLAALLLVVFCVVLGVSRDANCSLRDRLWTATLAWLALTTALLFICREVIVMYGIGAT